MTTYLSYKSIEIYVDDQVVMTNSLYRSELNQSTLRDSLTELVLFKIKLYNIKVLFLIEDDSID